MLIDTRNSAKEEISIKILIIEIINIKLYRLNKNRKLDILLVSYGCQLSEQGLKALRGECL